MKALLLAACLLALGAAPAAAGSCPDDQAGEGHHQDGPGETAGVDSETLVAFGLADDYAIARGLRVRRLTIAPGGVIALHAHTERPAGSYVISGTMTEYRNTCAVGVVYAPGDAVSEHASVSHWWRNESDAPAVVIVFDLPPE